CDFEGAVVGKHDSSRADAHTCRVCGYHCCQNFWRGTGTVPHTVMFGYPEALVAKALHLLRQSNTFRNRFMCRAATKEGNLIQYTQCNHCKPPLTYRTGGSSVRMEGIRSGVHRRRN